MPAMVPSKLANVESFIIYISEFREFEILVLISEVLYCG